MTTKRRTVISRAIRPSYMRPRACRRCGGDAFLDRETERDWNCLQCSRPVLVAEILTQGSTANFEWQADRVAS